MVMHLLLLDVIQVDATVIAGVLILMTIMSFKPQIFSEGRGEKVAKHLRSILMGGSITIFSFRQYQQL
jgi:hypothetical protein